MTIVALTTPALEQSKLDSPKNVASRRLVALLAVTSFLLVLMVAVSWKQSTKATNLRRIAREIHLGDNFLDVDARLGKATYRYESVSPIPGAPPKDLGAMYGGVVNDFREELDSKVLRVFRGYPFGFSPQSLWSWPVLIQYDGNMRVTGVIIDGVKVTSNQRPRNRRSDDAP